MRHGHGHGLRRGRSARFAFWLHRGRERKGREGKGRGWAGATDILTMFSIELRFEVMCIAIYTPFEVKPHSMRLHLVMFFVSL